MTATPESIRAAIETYAVLLNRSQWLDESRILMQESVWRRQLESHRGPFTTEVRLSHFEEAISLLLTDHRPAEIVPSMIIERACSIAQTEATEVSKAYAAWEAGLPILVRQVGMLQYRHDVPGFRNAVAQLRKSIAHSLLHDNDIEQILEAVDREQAEAIDELIPLEPGDVPELTDVIGEWLRPNE